MTTRFSWNDGLHERFWGAWPPGSARTSLQEDSLPISRLYFIGLQDDGNGNSQSQPPQGRDLNGMSSSRSMDKLTTVHKTHLQAFSTQLCLSSINMLETTHPFPALWGASVETCGGPQAMCHGKHPLHALLCPVARMHVDGTIQPMHNHLQGILLQAAMKLGHISGAQSSYVSQPADGRGNSVPQIAQVADRPSRDFPSTHTA